MDETKEVMMTNQLQRTLLRVFSVLLIFAFAGAFYLDWTFALSVESQKYQSEYPDAIRSGLSVLFLFSKVTWIVGIVSGALGIVLILFSKNSGAIPIALSAPLVALGAYLQAPQSNYPSVEPMFILLLWCFSSALWAAIVVLAWQRQSGTSGS